MFSSDRSELHVKRRGSKDVGDNASAEPVEVFAAEDEKDEALSVRLVKLLLRTPAKDLVTAEKAPRLRHSRAKSEVLGHVAFMRGRFFGRQEGSYQTGRLLNLQRIGGLGMEGPICSPFRDNATYHVQHVPYSER